MITEMTIEEQMEEARQAHYLVEYWRDLAYKPWHTSWTRDQYAGMAVHEMEISARLSRDLRRRLGIEP